MAELRPAGLEVLNIKLGESQVYRAYLGEVSVFLFGESAPLSADLHAVSGSSVELEVSRALSAVVGATSTVAADLVLAKLLQGEIAAVSVVAGDFYRQRSIVTTLAALSTGTGALSVTREATALIPGASTIAGNFWYNPTVLITAVSDLASLLKVNRGFDAAPASVSTLAASMKRARSISGIIPAVSTAAAALTRKRSFYGVLRDLGLTSDCVLCHDYADGDCFDGSGYLVHDLAGVFPDFWRGTTNGANAAAPTFVGTANSRDSGTYLQFPNSTFMRLSAANPAFITQVAKDSGIFTFMWFLRIAALGTGGRGFHGCSGASSSNRGFDSFITAGDNARLLICNEGDGAGDYALDATVGTDCPINTWHVLAQSLNEAGGSNNYKRLVHNTFDQTTVTYDTPEAGDPSYTFEIAARGNGTGTTWNNNLRMAGFMAFDTALSQANMEAIRDAIYAERFS